MARRAPRKGAFPFPISEGSKEPRNLTWLRNHSNYMVVRGLPDYLRAVGILLRGVLINALIFVPYLLAISLVMSVSILTGYPTPFIVTKLLLGFFALWILAFLVGTPLLRIARYQRTRATGSDSTVTQRDKYERTFGAFLIAILSFAALESLPSLLELYHGELGRPAFAVFTAAATGILGVYPKLMSALGAGLARKLALVAIGALGVFIPLLFVLFVSDFLVFGPPVDLTILNLLAGLPIPLFILLGIFIGWRQGAFKRKETAGIVLLVTASITLVALVIGSDLYAKTRHVDQFYPLAQRAIKTISQNPVRSRQLATHLSENPGREFAKLGSDFSGVVTPRLGTSHDEGWLDELASVGERAGRYPEFGQVVSAIAGAPACGADGLRERECVALKTEADRLKSSLETLAKLFEAKTRLDLATLLIGLEQREIEALKSDYPALRRLDGDVGCPTVQKRKTLDAAASDPGTCFKDIRSALVGYAKNIDAARLELAATESIELFDSESAFHAARTIQDFRVNAFIPKAFFVAIVAIQLLWFCWLTVDVNLTSIHGLYRDRLANAFLVGDESDDHVDTSKDVDLMQLCNRETGSIAPYHLINVALNLQGSDRMSVRDRQSDFFIFSKRFIGGKLTGYCRSETLERVFPQMDLGTAMAISAGAASPNMGRATNPVLVGIMTLLNVRMGFWLPNPGLLEDALAEPQPKETEEDERQGFSFDDVFQEELRDVEARWIQLDSDRSLEPTAAHEPSTAHRLAGIGFSGGGIRSATLNLGIAQALNARGVFDHFDYLSTVSGGGYLGSSISASMRRGPKATPASANAPGGTTTSDRQDESSVGDVFRWRVRPAALLREILGNLDEKGRWVNVSDGGHIENLAGIELLRRRCRYIIIGDGEADPEHQFNGLATLIQTARIDLGIHIDIDVDDLRLNEEGDSKRHWAVGSIRYPEENGEAKYSRGYLIYVKSSVTGKEDVVIQQYRDANPSFPHQSTADQFFNEGQFEAYRSLGQKIGENLLDTFHPETVAGDSEELDRASSETKAARISFEDFERWFEKLHHRVEA